MLFVAGDLYFDFSEAAIVGRRHVVRQHVGVVQIVVDRGEREPLRAPASRELNASAGFIGRIGKRGVRKPAAIAR